MRTKLTMLLLLVLALVFAPGVVVGQTQSATILNVSYDPTRELYDDYNGAFAAYWKRKTG